MWKFKEIISIIWSNWIYFIKPKSNAHIFLSIQSCSRCFLVRRQADAFKTKLFVQIKRVLRHKVATKADFHLQLGTPVLFHPSSPSIFYRFLTNTHLFSCTFSTCVWVVCARSSVWEFALRVIIFLKKFYQWSYIYLKPLIVKPVVLFWGYLKASVEKRTMWDLFMSHLFGLGWGTNTKTRPLVALICLLFLSWLHEWVLLGVALPGFSLKTLHTIFVT